MLQHLSIQNIVLIDRVSLPLDSGLCVLTGETGAGKSILLDALGLALGMRAESRLLRNGAEQGSITAEFDIKGNDPAKNILRDIGIDAAEDVIIRRNISRDGKSRCFINDQPVSATALKSLGEKLVEIHGQHDQRGLMNTANHLELLDAYGELGKLRTATAEAFSSWQKAQGKLEALLHKLDEAKREEEYLRFMRGELEQLKPKAGEEEELADLRGRMMQSEKLMEVLNDVMSELQGDNAVDALLHTAQRILARSPLGEDGRFSDIIESLEKATDNLITAQEALRDMADECPYDAAQLEQVEERLFSLRAAGRKYNLPVEELPQLLEEVTEKLLRLDNQHGDVEALQHEVENKKKAYRDQAEKLSAARSKAARQMEKAVMNELIPLKMGDTEFRVAMEKLAEEEWNARGLDRVRFEVATNKGSAVAPIHKIASGGELSRFMLAMKVVLSRIKSTPTLIFDEIDSGTGGAVADAIGQRLALISEEYQVLVVTHLPQVASKGTQHLRISKQSNKRDTMTSVEVLDVKERKEELARMLAGAEVTQEARSAAERLLKAG